MRVRAAIIILGIVVLFFTGNGQESSSIFSIIRWFPTLPPLWLPPPDQSVSILIQTLPNQTAFLTQLLNTTLNDLRSLVEDFNVQNITPSDVKFHLMVNSSEVQQSKDTRDIKKIDVSEPIKILIHGWKSSFQDEYVRKISSSYHKRGNFTVLAIDWSLHSSKSYHHACTGTQHVGQIVGDFILQLANNHKTVLKNIHIIGHSLGAHIAGMAGKRVKIMTGGDLVGRITALDAAAPLFEFPLKQPEQYRISKNDAKFVDSIHTNVGFLGMAQPFADADFYVENGGPVQPGCHIVANIIESFACSHYKANEYFEESIRRRVFQGTHCSDSASYRSLRCTGNQKNIMVEDVNITAHGTYFLNIA